MVVLTHGISQGSVPSPHCSWVLKRTFWWLTNSSSLNSSPNNTRHITSANLTYLWVLWGAWFRCQLHIGNVFQIMNRDPLVGDKINLMDNPSPPKKWDLIEWNVIVIMKVSCTFSNTVLGTFIGLWLHRKETYVCECAHSKSWYKINSFLRVVEKDFWKLQN